MAPRRNHLSTVSADRDPDHRARLIGVRDRLTTELATAPAAYVAGIARQLQAVLNEVASMRDPQRPPTSLENLQARYAARNAQDAVDGGDR